MARMFIGATAAALALAASAASAEEIAIALHVDPSHEMFQVGQRLKESIEADSEGRYEVVLLGTEVGGERDQVEATGAGEYQITLGGSMPMTLYAPEYAASDLPFVYNSSEEAGQVYEGETGEKIQQALIDNAGLRLVGLSVRNPRNLTSREPVTSPEDVQEVRMRVPEIAPWIKVWTEIGALPSPIAWPEVYTSLQTGVIDMQENPVDLIHAAKLYEVQDYIAQTEHVHSFFHWLMNEDFYQGLSEEDRQMIQENIDEAVAWGNELVTSNEEAVYEKLREQGMEVTEPDVAAFREAAAPAIREIAEGFDPAVRDYVLSHIE